MLPVVDRLTGRAYRQPALVTRCCATWAWPCAGPTRPGTRRRRCGWPPARRRPGSPRCSGTAAPRCCSACSPPRFQVLNHAALGILGESIGRKHRRGHGRLPGSRPTMLARSVCAGEQTAGSSVGYKDCSERRHWQHPCGKPSCPPEVEGKGHVSSREVHRWSEWRLVACRDALRRSRALLPMAPSGAAR